MSTHKTRKYSRPTVNGYNFIQKDAEWMESPAYRALRPLSRCLLDELLILNRPGRNGNIGLSTRKAAGRLGVSINTVLNAFDQLVEHGFLECVEPASWATRQARCWKLTILHCGNRDPTDDWRDWTATTPIRAALRTRQRKARSEKQRRDVSDSSTGLSENLTPPAQQNVVNLKKQ